MITLFVERFDHALTDVVLKGQAVCSPLQLALDDTLAAELYSSNKLHSDVPWTLATTQNQFCDALE